MNRTVCVALSACLLLAPSGCRLSQEVAAEKAARVRIGMTRAEVFQTLGEPDTRAYNLHDGAQEVWAYRFGQDLHPNPWMVFLGIVVLAAFVALVVAAPVSGLPSVAKSKPEGKFGVRVQFDAEAGVVRRVTVTPPQ